MFSRAQAVVKALALMLVITLCIYQEAVLPLWDTKEAVLIFVQPVALPELFSTFIPTLLVKNSFLGLCYQ